MALSDVMSARELDWRLGAVVYQVFVDRFAPPSDPGAKQRHYEAPRSLKSWRELPSRGDFLPSCGYWQHELDFWGGDLQSLRSKLPYLEDLGVSALYLQPIHEAYSNHKYDATDYMKVDPGYGTFEDYHALVQELHSKDMRLVLDGVFNHVGARNPIFQEAKQNLSSARRDWFYFGEEYGDAGYRGWAECLSLPELQLEVPGVRDYLWNSSDSVVAHWLKQGCDGWRLDVAVELGLEYLREIQVSAHRHKADCLVVGECWVWPPGWSALDGILSLHLGFSIIGLAKGSYSGPAFGATVQRIIADSAGGLPEILRSWIVLGNHDTQRVMTVLGGDLRKLMFAYALMFTLPGSPLIFYGDELGVEGGEDPAMRSAMPWEVVESGTSEMLAYTRKLLRLRRSSRALRIGDYVLLSTSLCLAFLRLTDRLFETVLVVANPTEHAVTEMMALPLPNLLGWTRFQDQLNPDSEVRNTAGLIEVTVDAKSVRILAVKPESDGRVPAQYKRTKT